MLYPMKKISLRAVAAACMVVAGCCLVTGLLYLGMNDKSAANRDFIEYWSAGQQLAHGANPYDDVAVSRLEYAAGLDGDQPKISFSPPVALFLTLPLGFVGPRMGVTLWSLALLASITASNWIIWILNGRPELWLHLLGYIFAPVVACQMAGQLGTFLLLGVVLFLLLHESRPFLAGAVLVPCTLKPHLFLPLAVVLLFWVLDKRAYRILVGFAATLFATCTLTLCFDPQVWSQYSQMMGKTGVLHAYVPALSVVLRSLIDRNAVWLQFLPEGCACLWAISYYVKRRDRWKWNEQGLLLLLVSALCTPYAWICDEAVLLPAVMAGLYRAIDSEKSLVPLVAFAGVALVEVLTQVKMTSPYYLWTTPAWLAWYLYSTGKKRAASETLEPVAENAFR
jgi:hypothetical protein